jgi:hypothetical protein
MIWSGGSKRRVVGAKGFGLRVANLYVHTPDNTVLLFEKDDLTRLHQSANHVFETFQRDYFGFFNRPFRDMHHLFPFPSPSSTGRSIQIASLPHQASYHNRPFNVRVRVVIIFFFRRFQPSAQRLLGLYCRRWRQSGPRLSTASSYTRVESTYQLQYLDTSRTHNRDSPPRPNVSKEPV